MKVKKYIALDKDLASELPVERKYTKLEAMFSLTIDFDKESKVTLTGYAKLWKWHKSTVKKFISDVGLTIKYPNNTQSKQNQRGLISVLISDRSWTDDCTDKRLIKAIPTKALREEYDRLTTDDCTDKRLISDRSTDSTINPKPKPKPKPKPSIRSALKFSDAFERWWTSYPRRNGRKVGKQKAAPLFDKIPQAIWNDLKTATENYSRECNGLPKDAERFLRNDFWKDFVKAADTRASPKDESKRERTWQEVADAMEPDGEYGIKLNFKD